VWLDKEVQELPRRQVARFVQVGNSVARSSASTRSCSPDDSGRTMASCRLVAASSLSRFSASERGFRASGSLAAGPGNADLTTPRFLLRAGQGTTDWPHHERSLSAGFVGSSDGRHQTGWSATSLSQKCRWEAQQLPRAGELACVPDGRTDSALGAGSPSRGAAGAAPCRQCITTTLATARPSDNGPSRCVG
jgi:hypothetical protein